MFSCLQISINILIMLNQYSIGAKSELNAGIKTVVNLCLLIASIIVLYLWIKLLTSKRIAFMIFEIIMRLKPRFQNLKEL